MFDLEYAIDNYDKIVFIKDSSHYFDYSANLSSDQLVLIIGTKPCQSENANFTYTVITQDDADKLERLYDTYEFSDNFLMLPEEDNSRVPSIFNFVKTGLLSQEEAWQALLH